VIVKQFASAGLLGRTKTLLDILPENAYLSSYDYDCGSQ